MDQVRPRYPDTLKLQILIVSPNDAHADSSNPNSTARTMLFSLEKFPYIDLQYENEASFIKYLNDQMGTTFTNSYRISRDGSELDEFKAELDRLGIGYKTTGRFEDNQDVRLELTFNGDSCPLKDGEKVAMSTLNVELPIASFCAQVNATGGTNGKVVYNFELPVPKIGIEDDDMVESTVESS